MARSWDINMECMNFGIRKHMKSPKMHQHAAARGITNSMQRRIGVFCLTTGAFIQGLPSGLHPIHFPSMLTVQTSNNLASHLFGTSPGYRSYLPVVTGGGGASLPFTKEPEIEPV